MGASVCTSDGRPSERLSPARQHERASPSASGDRKRGDLPPTVGRSRGGLPTKIHLVVDGQGRPLRFIGTAGQCHDSTQALALLSGLSARYGIADKAYDSQELLAGIEGQGATPVIPPRAGRRVPRPYDRTLYTQRNWIERSFTRLKHCRRLATRYDRKTTHFLAFLHLAAFALWHN